MSMEEIYLEDGPLGGMVGACDPGVDLTEIPDEEGRAQFYRWRKDAYWREEGGAGRVLRRFYWEHSLIVDSYPTARATLR